MRGLLLLFLLLTCYTASFCQSGKLIGFVRDSANKILLESATVSVFGPDSSLINYQLSDKNGRFVFEKLPLNRKVMITATYVGYSNSNSHFTISRPVDTLQVFLSVNPAADSNGVVVTAIVPVRMNGDTLEINPGAFKMKSGAVAEELLNQVPGITIWADGTITVNGNRVQNLLVEGKPFLGSSDPRVATQNLPKAAIDKIQLYQEYDRNNIGNETQPQDSVLTMNIKLKENSKKGFFGKAGVGYGTTDRYEADLSFQVYNKKSSLGIGGGLNNINKNIGSLQELFRNNTFSNVNPNLNNVGRFGNSGINTNHSIGGTYTHNFKEVANSRQNNRISLNFHKVGTDSYLADLSLQSRTTLVHPQFIREDGQQNNRTSRHNVGISYIKTNSYNDNLSLNGTVNESHDDGLSTRLTEVRNSDGQLVSTSNVTTLSSRQSNVESLNVNFAKSDNQEPLKNINVILNTRFSNSTAERNIRSTFESVSLPGENTTYNRRYLSDNSVLSTGLTFDYGGFKRLILGRYNLFNTNLRFNQRFNFTKSSDDNRVQDFDNTSEQFVSNNQISYINNRELLEYIPTLSLSKGFSKWSERNNRSINVEVKILDDIRTEKNWSSVAKRTLNRNFQFFRYAASLSHYQLKKGKYRYNTSLNYEKRVEYPTIDQLYPIIDDINAYEIRVGNPQLTNRINHSYNFNTSLNSDKPKSLYSFNTDISGGYTRILHPITDSIINDPSGKRTYYYTNADRSKNLYLNGNFNIARKFKKSQLQFTYAGTFSANTRPSFIDGVYTVSNNESLSNQFALQFSLRTLFIINIDKTLQHYIARQSAAGLSTFKNRNNATKINLVLNYPANISFSSTMESINSSNLKKHIILWNAFTTYRFMKQQGELKFSAMDLLHQYQNITNSVGPYGTTTRITNGLQQYFMMTFSYYPRKFGKKELKKQ